MDANGRDGGPSIGDLAYTELSRAIATCELAPGAPINERAEAARLGMSRTPFREALQRLALEGLIVAVPKRGTYVSPLDPDDITDNMAVRQAIETHMAARLLERGLRPAGAARLEANLAGQQAAIAGGDWLGFLHADEAFHQALLELAGSPRAGEAVRRSWIHVNRVRYLSPMTRSQMRAALRGHRQILDAVVARDARGTAEAIARHLRAPLSRRLRELRADRPEAFAEVASAARAHERLDGRVAVAGR